MNDYKREIAALLSLAKVEDDNTSITIHLVFLVARLTAWSHRVVERELEAGLLDCVATAIFVFALTNLLDDEWGQHIEPPMPAEIAGRLG